MQDTISRIEWPDYLKAKPDMCYESIAPLYHQDSNDDFGDILSFAVASTNNEPDLLNLRGCIHKLDIITASTLASATIKVTHEVIPKLGACAEIIPVNDKLRVACFDQGSIMPISNFGPKKTFHSDVRGRLQHHTSPVVCVASNTKGTQLASGSATGEIALYEVHDESITFTSRVNVSSSFVTGLEFLRPHRDICMRPNENAVLDCESMLIYSTQDGNIGLIDARCDLGQQIDFGRLMTTEPRLTLTSLCYIDSLPGQVIFFGSAQGQIVAVDLRYNNKYVFEQNVQEDGCIRRMKKVTIGSQDSGPKDFLAYTNETEAIKIIDPSSMQISESWTCDRPSTGVVKDFCQVGERIVTCGSGSSVGCWTSQID